MADDRHLQLYFSDGTDIPRDIVAPTITVHPVYAPTSNPDNISSFLHKTMHWHIRF